MPIHMTNCVSGVVARICKRMRMDRMSTMIARHGDRLHLRKRGATWRTQSRAKTNRKQHNCQEKRTMGVMHNA